ncbi:MAG: SIMPL domain-containing protein, partial [Bacillota bacterium]|nr:SIMPL domain-containing protein [Bacillota bacterium]
MDFENFYPGSFDQPKGVIKVIGAGSIRVEPDIALINLGVITEDMSLEKAQAENAARSISMLGSLYRLTIPKKDIQTLIYDIQPQYDFVEGRQVFRGYRVTNILTVTIRDKNSVGRVIDTATANGANRVENIRFEAENPSVYYKKALDTAVKDAAAKAREIGYSLGVQINPVPFRVSEITYSPVV